MPPLREVTRNWMLLMQYLREEIRKDPRPVPKAPPYPNKAFRYEQ